MNRLTAHEKQVIMDIFDHLHANPEVSWKEYQTTEYLTEKLKEAGCRTARLMIVPVLSAKSEKARLLWLSGRILTRCGRKWTVSFRRTIHADMIHI